MIIPVYGDYFNAYVEAIVNPVNTVGVMGKGIALQFRELYPHNYKLYKDACHNGKVKIGEMFTTIVDGNSPLKYIFNFPTKKHWKNSSRLEWIELGLINLKQCIIDYKVKSIAIPAIGCGLGGLNWQDVSQLIYQILDDVDDVNIFVYEPI